MLTYVSLLARFVTAMIQFYSHRLAEFLIIEGTRGKQNRNIFIVLRRSINLKFSVFYKFTRSGVVYNLLETWHN